MELLITREPRQLILANSTDALILRAAAPGPTARGSSQLDGSSPHAEPNPAIIVEFIPRSQLSESAQIIHPRIFGTLGLISIQNQTFLPIVTSATTLSTSHRSLHDTLGCEPISRILSVEFYCLTSSTYDTFYSSTTATNSTSSSSSFESATEYESYSLSNRSTPIGLTSTATPSTSSSSANEILEHPCAQIRKILCSGSFYFSGGKENTFDLSTRLQARLESRSKFAESSVQQDPESTLSGSKTPSSSTTSKGKGIDSDPTTLINDRIDSRFLWNTFTISPLLDFRHSLPSNEAKKKFDRTGFIVLAIQGYFGTYDLMLGRNGLGNAAAGGGEPATISLISRLGWKRAGTRFSVRGIEDDGNVANFVETETILRTSKMCFSFVQTRGSVPLFWEEGGPNPLAPKITITRPPEASLPAFVKHFEELLETYDSVHIVNLLSHREQEAALTEAYSAHLRIAQSLDQNVERRVDLTEFDFHSRSKIGGIESIRTSLNQILGKKEDEFGACIVAIEAGEPNLVTTQRGVFRTNCKDCLDRTNVVEDFISRFALEDFVRNTHPEWQGSDSALWSCHGQLFAENGDALSKIYVGTGAINTSFTRSGKSGFAGLLSNATKSVGRMYQSQFVDGGKQKAIDAFLGNLASSEKVRVFDPLNDLIRLQLKERASEYTTHETVTLFVGTYNLNGKAPGTESLLPWLFPVPGSPEPNLIVISFQEIVPLTPQMIMATDPEKKRRWEQHVLRCVAERPDKKADYILLRSGQLVGTALIVLIKKEMANEVKAVEVATKKTGLKGMAGNKGAVAIRLDYRDTSFCFLTAHFAAGHSNVDERNADFFTIERGLHFSRGRLIADHDDIIWAADTNYRISLPNEHVRELAESDDYASLLEADQLAQVMRTRHVFEGYYEAPILFRPTYKYDNFSDTYDSSEKQRIPAWTDRILYSGRDLDVTRYQRAELKASDHRPVYAIFRARVRSIDHSVRARLRTEIMNEIMVMEPGQTLDDKLAKLTNGKAPNENSKNGLDLPPPSDATQAWWNGADGKLNIDFDAIDLAGPGNGKNPFDSTAPIVPKKPSFVSSGSMQSVSSRRKAPPPPPSSSGSPNPSSIQSVTIGTDPLSLPSSASLAPPPIPRRPGRSDSVRSLLDEDDDEEAAEKRSIDSAEKNGWQVVG